MGTGLAQPKPNRKIAMVPMGSRWRSGFSETRPWACAVGSPSFKAIQAWANSWNVSEKRSTGASSSIRGRSKAWVNMRGSGVGVRGSGLPDPRPQAPAPISSYTEFTDSPDYRAFVLVAQMTALTKFISSALLFTLPSSRAARSLLSNSEYVGPGSIPSARKS